MVGPRDVVADDLGGVAPHEDRARMAHAGDQGRSDAHHQLEVLWRQAVGQLDRVVERRHADQRAVGLERPGGDLTARQRGELALKLRGDAREQLGRVRDADRAGHRVVLRLREHVARHPGGIGGSVGDDNDLARSRHHVDADLAEHAGLREGHVDVSGAHDLVDAPDRRRAVSERGYRLGTADAVALGDPGEAGSGEHGGLDPAAGARRRDEHDLADAGDTRRHRGHQDCGRIGGAPARRIDPRPIERPDLLAEDGTVLIGQTP